MRTKLFKFDTKLYPIRFLVCTYLPNISNDELKELFYVLEDERTVIEAGNEFKPTPTTTARTVPVVDKKENMMYVLVLIYRPNAITQGIVAHESFHAAMFISEWLGFEAPTSKNNEPQAYLLQFFTDAIHSVLKGKPEKMGGVLYSDK